MLKRIIGILFSSKVTGALLLVFASAMAIATFIENDYNTETAKALVYGAQWFEILILLLAFNFIGNIAKYKLLSWEKAPIFLFHFAFIVIILGAGITRYRGYEALLTIKEGETNSRMVSIDSYLQTQISNGTFAQNHISKPLLMSEIGTNKLYEKIQFNKNEINIQLKKYIPRATYIIEKSKSGKNYLHLVISSNEERKDFYIQKGTREVIYGIPISFESNTTIKGDIIIQNKNDQWHIKYPEATDYFDMIQNKAGSYPKDSVMPLPLKVLHNIKGTSLVFNDITKKSVRKLISSDKKTDKKNPESAIILEISSKNETKEVTLLGGPGYVNPTSSVYIDDYHMNLRYGSKLIDLPFSLYLSDFTLERYPGSDSPSAFYSNLEIQDQNKLFHYTIFMNNVLNYKGFRFFQSAYTPDELGTILSVNHDYWGTFVTYIGYALLGLGMVLSLFWKNSHFYSLLTLVKTHL